MALALCAGSCVWERRVERPEIGQRRGREGWSHGGRGRGGQTEVRGRSKEGGKNGQRERKGGQRQKEGEREDG